MSSLLKSPKKRREVMLLNPVDFSYTSLEVDNVTEEVIYCKKHEGVLPRFFKFGPGWKGKDTRFLAVEGNPLVSFIKEDEVNGVKTKIEMDLGKYLKTIWGDKAYGNLHPTLKKGLDERAVGATVTVAPYIPNDKMQAAFDEIKAAAILYDADLENLARMGEAKEVKKWTDKMIDKLPWILAGIGLTYILQGIGLIKGF